MNIIKEAIDSFGIPLGEGLSSVLYHSTDIWNVEKILKDNEFRLSTSAGTGSDNVFQKGKNVKLYFMSTTRGKTGRYHATAGSLTAILVLDGDKLGQRYEGAPVDYWGREFRKADPRSEQEDRIWSDKPTVPNAKDYIQEIHVLLKDPSEKMNDNWARALRRMLIEAKKANIPVYVYSDEDSWRLQNKENVIDLADINLSTDAPEEPKSYWMSTNQSPFDPYLELYYSKDRSKLSKKAGTMLYDLKWMGYRRDIVSRLAADLHNDKKKDTVRGIVDVMHKEGLKSPQEFIDLLVKKWELDKRESVDEFGIPLEERNVANINDIEKYLQSIKVEDPKIRKWLDSNLRNYLIRDHKDARLLKGIEGDQPEWLKKAIAKGDEVFVVEMPKYFTDQIQHVIDYLKSPEAPTDLTRLTVPDAIKKSEMWLKDLLKKTKGKTASGDVEVIKEYPDGFYWLNLKDQAALDYEGDKMGHCVAGYCGDLKRGTQIISLRDSKDEPHCTIELRGDYVQQIKGKGNKPVIDKYRQYVKNLLDTELKDIEVETGELNNIGLIKLDGKITDIEEIKKDPEKIKSLVKEVFPVKGNEEVLIEKDSIYVYGDDIDTFIDRLDRLRMISKDDLPDMEEFVDVDWSLKDIDVSDIIDGLEKRRSEDV